MYWYFYKMASVHAEFVEMRAEVYD